ncbi:MAG TPA: hypothetical protein VID70_10030 [Solirubrobacteraceae bacterium]
MRALEREEVPDLLAERFGLGGSALEADGKSRADVKVRYGE